MKKLLLIVLLAGLIIESNQSDQGGESPSTDGDGQKSSETPDTSEVKSTEDGDDPKSNESPEASASQSNEDGDDPKSNESPEASASQSNEDGDDPKSNESPDASASQSKEDGSSKDSNESGDSNASQSAGDGSKSSEENSSDEDKSDNSNGSSKEKSSSQEDSGSSSEEDSGSSSQEHEDCWTEWLDRDDPTGSGDWETLENLYRENPEKICNMPLRIQVKTTSGHSVSSTGDVISVSDTSRGFVCKNSDQESGSQCHDYQVRFLCPEEFCIPKVCWTEWYDRDSPRGIGDYELLCNLRAENPGKICAQPLYMEVQNKMNNMPAAFSGNKFHIYSPSEGFACRNCDQKEEVKSRCEDYKVRFGCPCDM